MKLCHYEIEGGYLAWPAQNYNSTDSDFIWLKSFYVDFVVRRVDQMEGSQITRGRGRPRKTISKDLEINELALNMVYDRTLWRNLIHVADPN
jgi:predicted GNAT superfamily acetyltransferase